MCFRAFVSPHAVKDSVFQLYQSFYNSLFTSIYMLSKRLSLDWTCRAVRWIEIRIENHVENYVERHVERQIADITYSQLQGKRAMGKAVSDQYILAAFNCRLPLLYDSDQNTGELDKSIWQGGQNSDRIPGVRVVWFSLDKSYPQEGFIASAAQFQRHLHEACSPRTNLSFPQWRPCSRCMLEPRHFTLNPHMSLAPVVLRSLGSRGT